MSETAKKLYTKQLIEIKMIRDRAIAQAKRVTGKIEILTAFYGAKLPIQEFIEEKRMAATED